MWGHPGVNATLNNRPGCSVAVEERSGNGQSEAVESADCSVHLSGRMRYFCDCNGQAFL